MQYTIGFVCAVAVLFAFGVSPFWRFVGLLQVLFSISILRNRRVGIGIEGRRPTFYLTGVPAVFAGLLSLGLGLALLLRPDIFLAGH